MSGGIEGGLTTIQVADLTRLAAYPVVAVEGIRSYVITLKAWFTLQSTTLPPDGITVVSSPTPLVWVREDQANLDWQNQTEWFIDPIAGNDENNGSMLGTALQSVAEWYRRTAGGYYVDTLMTLVGAGGAWLGPLETLNFAVKLLAPSSATFTIEGNDQAPTFSNADTSAAAAADPVGNTPPTFDGGIALPGSELQLLVVNPGVAATYAWILFVPAVGTTVVVSPWVDINGNSVPAPAVGIGIPFEVRPVLGGFDLNGLRCFGQESLLVRKLRLPFQNDGAVNYELCRMGNGADRPRASAVTNMKGCCAEQFSFSSGQYRLENSGAGFQGPGTGMSIGSIGRPVAAVLINVVSIGTIIVQEGANVAAADIGIWHAGAAPASGLAVITDAAVRSVGGLYGGSLVNGLSQASFGADVATGGLLNRGLGSPLPVILGSSAELRLDLNGPSYIAPLMPGSAVPSLTAGSTWAAWDALFGRRLVGYTTGSRIVGA
jgi:hypothetical protein